jgi:hypothetical protein
MKPSGTASGWKLERYGKKIATSCRCPTTKTPMTRSLTGNSASKTCDCRVEKIHKLYGAYTLRGIPRPSGKRLPPMRTPGWSR